MAVYLLTDKHYCYFDSEGLNFIYYLDSIYSVHFYWINLNLVVGVMNEIFNWTELSLISLIVQVQMLHSEGHKKMLVEL